MTYNRSSLAPRLHSSLPEVTMIQTLKKLLLFRASQTSARGLARLLGFGRLAAVVGVVAGIRSLRHRRRHA